MLKYNVVRYVTLQDWDALVENTYGRIYAFQQQGYKDRGTWSFVVPEVWDSYDEAEDAEQGKPTLEEWLARGPKAPTPGRKHGYEWEDDFWWSREFYPPFESVLRDLSKRGLVEPGKYILVIDW